jgi:hypothetical protein
MCGEIKTEFLQRPVPGEAARGAGRRHRAGERVAGAARLAANADAPVPLLPASPQRQQRGAAAPRQSQRAALTVFPQLTHTVITQENMRYLYGDDNRAYLRLF